MNAIIKNIIQENFPGLKNMSFFIKRVHQHNGFFFLKSYNKI